MRALLAGLLLVAPAPTATASITQTVIFPAAILRVDCFIGDDEFVGTAVRVGPRGQFVSVNHVTSQGTCTVGGDPLPKTWKSPSLDFSMFAGSGGAYIGVDCGGYVKGRKYLAIGFARGRFETTTIELEATGLTDNRMALLTGIFAVVPGQSGGAIVSEDTGRIVGVVNAENYEQGLSWSVELRDTPVCKGRVA